ncbi:MAG: hypothetical protein KKH61_20170 [Gammaproteobacteria bacterium]|nr:hypothetical protein [Gammaproteobacteria bacterium]
MIDHDALVAEIVELSTIPVIGPSDITIADYEREAHCGRHTAMGRLRKLVDEGVLDTAIKFDPHSRRQIRVWFKV